MSPLLHGHSLTQPTRLLAQLAGCYRFCPLRALGFDAESTDAIEVGHLIPEEDAPFVCRLDGLLRDRLG